MRRKILILLATVALGISFLGCEIVENDKEAPRIAEFTKIEAKTVETAPHALTLIGCSQREKNLEKNECKPQVKVQRDVEIAIETEQTAENAEIIAPNEEGVNELRKTTIEVLREVREATYKAAVKVGVDGELNTFDDLFVAVSHEIRAERTEINDQITKDKTELAEDTAELVTGNILVNSLSPSNLCTLDQENFSILDDPLRFFPQLQTVRIVEDSFISGNLAPTIYRMLGGQNITISGDSPNDTLDYSIAKPLGSVAQISGFSNFQQTLNLSGIESINGSSADDVFTGDDIDNHIYGFGGDDLIMAGNGSNIFSGGAGDDLITGGDGEDKIRGGADNDVIHGRDGDDVIDGGPGNDMIFAGPGNDRLISGTSGVYETFKRPKVLPSIRSKTKNDIVFVIFDDLAAFSNILGEMSEVMPNLHNFSNSSLNFENAYANVPICNPSRASLLSGTYPETSKVYGSLQNRLTPDSWLIQKYLENNGFEVGEFGKVRNHSESQNDIGIDNHFFRPVQVRNTGVAGNFGIVDIEDRSDLADKYSDAAATDAAIEFMATSATNKPRATFLGLTRPHAPWIVPREDWDAIAEISDEEIKSKALSLGQVIGVQNQAWLNTLSPYTVSAQRISSNIGPEENSISAIRHYMASAHLSDRLFGEFMESVPDDVTVIVTSDHGMHMTDVHPGLNKTTLWPQSLRVPLLIRHGNQAGIRKDVVGLVDLYKTITDLSGVSTPAHVEGRSLEPLIRILPKATKSKTQPSWEDVSVAMIGMEFAVRAGRSHGWFGWAVTTDKWHYIRDASGDEELYDNVTDTQARNNLATIAAYDGLMKELSAYIPRSNIDELFGGSGNDIYDVGAGNVIIEDNTPNVNNGVDQVNLDFALSDLSFSSTSLRAGDNGNTLKVSHPGGELWIYNHNDPEMSSIEVLRTKDGCFELK